MLPGREPARLPAGEDGVGDKVDLPLAKALARALRDIVLPALLPFRSSTCIRRSDMMGTAARCGCSRMHGKCQAERMVFSDGFLWPGLRLSRGLIGGVTARRAMMDRDTFYTTHNECTGRWLLLRSYYHLPAMVW